MASGSNDHILAQPGSDNFIFTVQFSDVDMETSSDSLALPGKTVAVETDLEQGLATGSSLVVTGDVSLTVPTSDCASIEYLCIHVQAGADACYTDAVDTGSSNSKCIPIADMVRCETGQ